MVISRVAVGWKQRPQLRIAIQTREADNAALWALGSVARRSNDTVHAAVQSAADELDDGRRRG
jgi:hypothetical protein